jgi:hypothetical protein
MIFARRTGVIRCRKSAITDRTLSISSGLHGRVNSPTEISWRRRHGRAGSTSAGFVAPAGKSARHSSPLPHRSLRTNPQVTTPDRVHEPHTRAPCPGTAEPKDLGDLRMRAGAMSLSVDGMPGERNVGRARVSRPPRGRARVGRSVGKAPLPERAVTSILPAAGAETPPVFVDPSGVRRRRLRLAVYALGLVLAAVLAAVWLSQLGGGPAAPPKPTPCPAASSAGGCVR